MSGYVDHAWRHRPASMGGTDPVAFDPAVFESAQYAVVANSSFSHVGVSQVEATWTSFQATDLSVFRLWDSHSILADNTSGCDRIEILQTGIMIVWGLASWPTGDYVRQGTVTASATGTPRHKAAVFNYYRVPDAGTFQTPQTFDVLIAPCPEASVSLSLFQQSGTKVVSAEMRLVFLPLPSAAATIF